MPAQSYDLNSLSVWPTMILFPRFAIILRTLPLLTVVGVLGSLGASQTVSAETVSAQTVSAQTILAQSVAIPTGSGLVEGTIPESAFSPLIPLDEPPSSQQLPEPETPQTTSLPPLNEPSSGQSQLEQPLPEQPLPEQPLPKQPLLEQPFSDQAFSDQALPEQPLPEQPLPEQPFLEQPFLGQPLPKQEISQTVQLPAPQAPSLPPLDEPPSSQPLPESEPPQETDPVPQLPPPESLLQSPSDDDLDLPNDVPERIFIDQFDVQGSTVFSSEELEAVTAEFTGRELSFAELLQARSAVTQLYVDNGYVTSGAFIPPQTLDGNVVVIEVLEGRLDEINVDVDGRLRSRYIRNRLELAGKSPLNVNDLLEGLQLLQLNPLVDTISAELASGVQPGTSILDVEVDQADTFDVNLLLNNGRSPSVGSFRRQVQVTERNLTGLGDLISVGYSNTDGSDTFDLSYTLPVNPRNGTVNFSVGTTDSEVIEDPFDSLNIQSESRYYELTYRQPIYQTPSDEFALSLTASRRESKSEFLEGVIDDGPEPFPSLGADSDGRTRISALRFAQEWTQQGSQQVIAARSQFSLGLDAFDSTINDEGPDSEFFAWRGQAQWVRLLARDTLLLLRTDVQLADGSLVPLEQFGLGGQQTVRGYRQDELLTDNGVLFSGEVRIPILRVRDWDALLQVTPFFDVGKGWNLDATDPDPSALAALGLGLRWTMGDRLTARFDWGIPLVDVENDGDTLQEDGVYFSINFNPF